MINFDVIKENIKEHTPKWPQIPDHPHKMLVVGVWGPGKKNSLFNLINYELDINLQK